LLARRTLFDRALSQALVREPGVHTSYGNPATGLLIDFASANQPPRVFGLTTPAGQVTADLVIDAAGWRSPVRRWLAENQIQLGVQNDPTSFFYVTRHYRLRVGAAFPSTRVPIVVMLDCISAIAFAEDNGHFQLTVQFDVFDRLKRLWLDPVLFERGLAEIPEMAPWLAAGEPTGDPEPIYSVGNCRKQIVVGKPLATGLLLLGDAAVHTNPSAARGIAMALAHARELANFLAEQPSSANCAVTLTEAWEDATSRLVLVWLDSQIRIDRQRRRQVRAALAGAADDGGKDRADRLAAVLAAPRDDEVGAAAEKIFNMLMTPAELLRDRSIMKRALRESRAGIPARSGPTRAEFERLMRQ
jgi:2-polyprenyl-6-methoxyphenol hydroxylase-like FAD-dependent oxidoreductase